MEMIRSTVFDQWLGGLRDSVGRDQITARLDRIVLTGHFGDHHYLCDGVSELRFKRGPGYRIYFAQRGKTIIVLLCGGDKSTQQADIQHAVKILQVFDQQEKGK